MLTSLPSAAARVLASIAPDLPTRGAEVVTRDGRSLPLVSARLTAEAQGGIARLVLEQRFENRHAETLHVTYRMPLPADGAVSGYAFELAGRTIAGRIERKRAAREQFERASADRAARRLIDRTRMPMLTDVTLAGSAVIAQAPERLPDVFEGAPLVAAVKLRAGELVVRGDVAGGAWEKRMQVWTCGPGGGNQAIVSLFGREHVADLEARAIAGEPTDGWIEQAGLEFQIATRFTSWIAIDEARAVTGPSRHEVMPQALPYGTTAAAFGLRAAVDLEAAGEFEDEPTLSEMLRGFDAGEAPALRASYAFAVDDDSDDSDHAELSPRHSSRVRAFVGAEDDGSDGEVDDLRAEASASSLLMAARELEFMELEGTLEEPIPAPEPSVAAKRAVQSVGDDSAMISRAKLRRAATEQPLEQPAAVSPPELAPEPRAPELRAPEQLPAAPAPAMVPYTRGMRIAAYVLLILALIVLITALVLWLVR
jgi:hypothetical protein